MEDYHDAYQKTHVVLLVDIFEKFRSVCLSVYQLDSTHFYSVQIWVGSLCSSQHEWNWDFCKMLICFCFLSVASGVASMELASCGILLQKIPISTHPIQVRKLLSAHFMIYYFSIPAKCRNMMPRENYRWNSERTVKSFLETPESSNIGYFVETDLKYPQYIHDLHNGLSLAPEKRTIRSSWLSTFAQFFGIKPNKPPKFIETLLDKKNYVCHDRNLKVYIKHGLIFKKIASRLRIPAKKMVGRLHWKNTVMRKQATNEFEKNFFKLTSNACFGKTMEMRKHPN